MERIDHNLLAQGMRQPISQQAPIAAKAKLNDELIDRWKENAENSVTGCYPGGGENINHDIMKGYLLLAEREYIADSEFDEAVVASVAGLCYAAAESQRAVEDQFVVAGISTNNVMLSKGEDGANGIATLKAGTVSTVNNGPFQIYANQWLSWRLPLTDLSPENETSQTGIDGMQTVLNHTRPGFVPTQYRPEIVPFDHTDYRMHVAAAYAAVSHSNEYSDPGISNVPFTKFFERPGVHDAKSITHIQESGMALRYGDIGLALRMIEVYVRHGMLQAGPGFRAQVTSEQEKDAVTVVRSLSDQVGLFETSPSEQQLTLQRKLLASVYMRSINPGDPERIIAERIFLDNWAANAGVQEDAVMNPWFNIATLQSDTVEALHAKLFSNMSEVRYSGVSGKWHSMLSKVFARSLNDAATSDTLHLMLGNGIM